MKDGGGYSWEGGRNWCLGVDRCMHVAGHMAGEEQ